MIEGHGLHFPDERFICGKHPPQKANEEQKKYHERDHRPDGDVVDTL
jgi:hypothetical protein